jgi:hypothetical protein
LIEVSNALFDITNQGATMFVKKILSLILITSALLGSAPQLAVAQGTGTISQPNRDLPVVITVGRPNIWSLEQAHYLLGRMHHRNRELEANPLKGLDPNQVNATRMKILRQILGIGADFAQTKTPKSDDEEKTEKETAENKAELEVKLPESVIKNFDKFISDPKLNASMELDNYIKLQYEIVAQQLTLLRDEVGAGERLVFLELPHSIYTTPEKADKRLAQVWWRVEGFSRLNKEAVEKARKREPLNCVLPANLFEENQPLKKVGEIIQSARVARDNFFYAYAKDRRATKGLSPDCTEYVPLYLRSTGKKGEQAVDILTRNSDEPVRTIDLIPRQSSLIVNETYDSVKGLNIWGGFAWLFGLGVKGSFQRQKEEFQQFLHQEVYASGFGKGETDFGWTFGPLPGTKRLAPGLRTTYAVVIVPKEAETIVLKSRSCFFKQKYNQPYNYHATGNWNEPDDDKFCEAEQEFTIPIPNGGDYQGFRVDEVRYLAGQEPGNRIVVSAKGQNFSPQLGVMINGVPLCQSVGIAQPYLDKINTKDTSCAEKDGIAGQVEYVGLDEIVFVFKMPKEFKGTPTIHFIGPGRTAYLNRLPNVRVNGTIQRLEEASLMFGAKTEKGVAIKDLKVYRTANPSETGGLLIGEKFRSEVQVYVNGEPARATFLSDSQISINFSNQGDDKLNVTVIQDKITGSGKDTDTSTFSNLPALTVTQVSTLSYDPPKGDEAGILLIKVEGKGLTGLTADIKGASNKSELLEVSPNEAILKLVKPEPIIQITLKNSRGQMAKAVVVRPQPAASKDK